MTSTAQKALPQFSRRAFWSDKTNEFDVNTDADYLIARAFDAGTYEDMQEAIRYYGVDRIKESLPKAPDLQSSTIAYTAIWLNLKPEEFRAHRRSQQNPQGYPTF